MKYFVVRLKCGCAASWVFATDGGRAAQILFGRKAPAQAKGARLAEVDQASFAVVFDALKAAGPQRWECRGNHARHT